MSATAEFGAPAPVGSYFECLYGNPIARWLCRTFGSPDIHTHYRLRPVMSFFRKELAGRRGARAIEVGSGSGINLFELKRMCPGLEAKGFDLDAAHIGTSRLISERAFGGAVEFRHAAASTIRDEPCYDFVLFIDFLEHVRNPAEIIRNMDGFLRPGGKVVVSVPTPRYPRVFGRAMHERIGHVVDGYLPETLTELFPAGYKRLEYGFSTGLLASAVCVLGCRVLAHVPGSRFRWMLSAPLLWLGRKGPDPLNGPRWSCSLFAVFEKTA